MANGSEVEDFKPDRQMVVTDQMVAAGMKIVEDRSPHGVFEDQARAFALEVFFAMLQASSEPV